MTEQTQQVGMIRLVVFGGSQPGETWQVEYISGYLGTSFDRPEIIKLYMTLMSTLKIGQVKPDQVDQSVYDWVDQKHREADRKDKEALIAHNKEVDAIRTGILGSIKGRQHF